MSEIPKTKEEANSDLQRIRDSRTVNGEELNYSTENISDLHEALNIISNQLYKTPTHFLLELIQNADDNRYGEDVQPKIHISLYERRGIHYLRTDCNEVGFTFEQVKALTRVGFSTKKRQNGYIGEKGIGFKSVFKVADIVAIASGFYEFKLDRNKPVGMVRPILTGFPSAHRVEGCTQFLLKLKSNHDYNNIRGDLNDIEPQLLMFLRKLDSLRVTTPSGDMEFKNKVNSKTKCFKGETMTVTEYDLERDSTKKTKYVIVREAVSDLPKESRREGIATSEVMLAFPVKDQTTPMIKPQTLFAFLPVGKVGFRFLIHADFLLIANRENLEEGCRWNLALRDGVQEAILKGIKRFASMPEDDSGHGLCYEWPQYISRPYEGDRFWQGFYDRLLSKLREMSILKSQDEDAALQRPAALRYVPPEFRFEGDVLFDLPPIRRTYLAFNYDGVKDQLLKFGVQRLTIQVLLEEFCEWLEDAGDNGLESQAAEWHSKLATIFCDRYNLLGRLRDLPIIPLRDGSWVEATTEHLYLASNIENEHVPTGVAVSIVDQEASRDSRRRRFFEFLEIKQYTPGQVCSLILDLHTNTTDDLCDRTDEDLIDDLKYLFEHRRLLNCEGVPSMIFVVQRDGRVKRKRTPIYIVDPTIIPCLLEKYRESAGNPFSVLDKRYETAICNNDARTLRAFRKWLLQSETSCFASTPALVRSGKRTLEWEFLRDANVLDLLFAVKLHLKLNPNNGYPNDVLSKAVPKLEMTCRDGVTRPLKGLALPSTTLVKHCPHLEFADFPDPTRKNWGFLSQFGVLTDYNMKAVLWELQALRQLPLQDVKGYAVHDIYRSLSSTLIVEDREIRDVFSNHSLVFISQPNPKWVKHSSCVWNAPSALRRVIRLQSHYADCEKLFHNILNVKPAQTRHVVDEICSLSNGSCRDAETRLVPLLSLLKDYSDEGLRLKPEDGRRLSAAKVFPVLEISEPPHAVSAVFLHSLDDESFAFPDKTTLRSAFYGKINMLSISVKQILPLMTLLENINCIVVDFTLSEAVTEEVEPHGMSIRDKSREQELQSRLQHISYLAQAGDRSSLPALRVWSVPSITITRRLWDVEVVSHDELVTIREPDDDTIEIYLREDLAELDGYKVRMQLATFFSGKFHIDSKDHILLDGLLSAPVSQLKTIMESHGRFLPEEPGDSKDGTEDLESSNASNGGETVGNGSEAVGDDGVDMNNEDGSDAEQRNSASGSTTGQNSPLLTPTSSQSSPSLRELIPSHQEMLERTIERAANFPISESVVVRPSPTHHNAAGSPFQVSLPIRTAGYHHTGQSSSAHQQTPETPPQRRHRHTSSSSAFARTSYQPISPRQSANRRSPGANPRDAPVTDLRHREIGFLGEAFIHHLFTRYITDWDYRNWTSQLRVEDGHPRFTEREKDFADFTYEDRSGHMRYMLRDAGVEIDEAWTSSTTYHIEVKGTLSTCSEPFFVSQNQVDLMRRYHDDPHNAYILVRVFNLEGGNVGIKVFPKTWSLYVSNVLDFRSDQGYTVRGGDKASEIRF